MPDGSEALERGDAFVELDDTHVTRVSGGDARSWLHDLVTTDVASLAPGEASPSLLLTPTGRIRAQFHVAAVTGGAFLMIQREPFETAVSAALSPYVLSSDVDVAGAGLAVVAVPGAEPGDPRLSAASGGATTASPSVLGGGSDLFVDAASLERVVGGLAAAGLEVVGVDATEARRIRRGDPRFGFELDADSLPAEAALDMAPVTDRTKGCFLGQESVAKVANLGHPNRVLLGVFANGPLTAGEVVLAGGEPVGALTSAYGSSAIARVAWSARDLPLETPSGVRLETLRAG